MSLPNPIPGSVAGIANMQRSPTDTSSADKRTKRSTWLRKISSINKEDWSFKPNDRNSTGGPYPEPESPSLASPDYPIFVSPHNETNHRHLREHVARMKAAPTDPGHVDNAYREYTRIKEQCNALCRALLTKQRGNAAGQGGIHNRLGLMRENTISSHGSDGPVHLAELVGHPGAARNSHDGTISLRGLDARSSLSAGSLADRSAGTSAEAAGSHPTHVSFAWLETIREWKACLETLIDTIKTNLAETYKSYEKSASPEMVDLLFNDKRFRTHAVSQMRNAALIKMISASPDFWPKYEIRFRNYERAKAELVEIRYLLQAGESGISPDRDIRDTFIAPRGDAILEFANLSNESKPVYRFRVSSHMLSQTSPIFARMFLSHPDELDEEEGEVDVSDELPLPPTRYTCRDGAEARLYRMPQLELNRENALSILLHAAHMHNDKVPRDIEFDQFVAIAEACMRYRCTSPVELMVEHRWLPQWSDKAIESMPDGMLLICYAFGLRRLFTRMSKTIILNLVDERELQAKSWPEKIKEKIWAVRQAKMAQVHACCTSAVEEYLRPPTASTVSNLMIADASSSAGRDSMRSASSSMVARGNPQATQAMQATQANLHIDTSLSPNSPSAEIPTTSYLTLNGTPRCPRGSHWCDATNLGWLMLVYNELQLLGAVIKPAALTQIPPSPNRSLADLLKTLRLMASPPEQAMVHRGVCDYAPAFRAAVNDIYNSVTGLTLFEVNGRRHGWALSQHHHEETEPMLRLRVRETEDVVERPASPKALKWEKQKARSLDLDERICLCILRQLDDIDDVHATAVVDRTFYKAYQMNELELMRRMVNSKRRRTIQGGNNSERPTIMSGAHGRRSRSAVGEKVLKIESDGLKGSRPPIAEEDREKAGGKTAYALVGRADETGNADEDVDDDDDRIEVVLSNPTSPTTASSPLSPRTIRYPSIPFPSPAPAVQLDMSEEEARRILWPDPPPRPPESRVSSPRPKPLLLAQPLREGCPARGVAAGLWDSELAEVMAREKFLAGDVSFAEEKSLAVTGDKQLREERDRRVGLKHDAPRVEGRSGREAEGQSGVV